MPYFGFSASDGTLIIQPQFWIYWALTIPLTLTVLVVYLAYLLWIQNKHRVEDDAARKDLDAEPQPDHTRVTTHGQWDMPAHVLWKAGTQDRFRPL